MVKTSAIPVYVICSGGKPNPCPPDVPPYGLKYIETACKVLGKTFGEAAKLEECRKEIDEDYNNGVPKQRTAAKGQTTFEKSVLSQNIRYALEEDLERVKKVFEGCPPYLVAGQVMCAQGIDTAKAARILPDLGVNLSLKELKEVYSAIPPDKIGTVENVRAFSSKKYQAHLGNLKKTFQEARRMGLTAYLEAHSP